MAGKIGSLQSGVSLVTCLLRGRVVRCVTARPSTEANHLCRYFSVNKRQPPKRPLTAFFDFLGQKRDEIKRNNPEAKTTQVASIAGQMWQQVSPEEKQEKADRRMEAYKVQRDHFLSELTESDRAEMKKSQQEHRKKLKHRRKIHEFHQLGKPKRPTTSYMMFIKSNQMERGDAPLPQYVKGLAERWKQMPEEDKLPYKTEADADRERYYQEMVVWEERMLEAGRPDLVRGYRPKKPAKRRRRRTSKTMRKRNRKPIPELEEFDDEVD